MSNRCGECTMLLPAGLTEPMLCPACAQADPDTAQAIMDELADAGVLATADDLLGELDEGPWHD